MNEHEELGKNIKKLLSLLKKIMKQQGGPGSPMGSAMPPEMQQMLGENAKNLQLNLCLFAFLPVDPTELEEMQDGLESQLFGEGMPQDDEALAFEITPSDTDFLKKYGIKF